MDFLVNGSVYTARWKDEALSMHFNRLREASSGSVSAEVLIQNHNDTNPHVHHARLNLVSTRSRAEVAKHCTDRFPTIDWVARIEQACVAALRTYREGEPVVDITEMPVSERLRYRVEPLLVEGHPNLIFGDGGLGKSLFATYLSVLIAGGIVTNRLICEPGKVLYLDYEASVDELKERYDAISAGLETDPPSMMYQFNYEPVAGRIEELQAIVAEHNIGFVIIDSAAPACGDEPEMTKNAIAFFRALRSLKVTTLTVAHVSKAGGGKAGPFGSKFWLNYPRSVWEVRKAQEPGQNSIDFSLWHRKVNSSGLLAPLAYRVRFDTDEKQIVFDDIAVKDSEELAKGLPLPHRIKAALEDGAMRSKDIAELLEVNANTLGATLSRDKKRFVLLPDGRWGNRERTFASD